ncbi:OprD family outer membrane porin [uncultured Campylobacter sp.]|uniref:OprD family outer membrane porin n=1 Tax=uncultured Campylobacter sp. TaxID=218934 RepID=UPI002633E292|nr:OprD family outer membrane porin [uncultured Campylobacter sp.]
MKLVKLSLAAAVAAGALAMSASAVPLEEAIKDVDLNGYARMRYTHDHLKNETNSNKGVWEFKSEVDFKAKIDDNFFGVVGVRFLDRDNGESLSSSNSQYHGTQNPSDKDSDFDIAKAYLGYTIGGTTIAVGRQGIGSFFTDDMYGDGVKITSTDIEGLTISGFWMDSLENDGDISSLDWGAAVDNKLTTDHNLYGIGFMGSYDPVSFQLWYNALEDVAQLFAAELALNFDISDDFNLGVKGQYAFSDFDGDYKDAGASDADFWAAEANAGFFGVDLAAGYLKFEPDDKDKVSFVSFEDQGSFISPGEELLDYRNFSGENHYWYVVAGYTIPDTGIRIGADYLDGKADGDNAYEVVGRISYKYNEKLSFKTWYSHYKIDGAAGAADDKNDRIRFEAKYSF